MADDCLTVGGRVTAVLRADARRLPLTDSTVDLVVTSPPYFALRSYQDGGEHYEGQVGSEATPSEFVDALLTVTAECVRVLKPSGSIWVNLGDKYAGSASGGTQNGARGKRGTDGDRKRGHLRTAAGVMPHSNVRRLPGLDECVACSNDLRPGDALLCGPCAWESRRDGSRR